jgi:hypothetical protein
MNKIYVLSVFKFDPHRSRVWGWFSEFDDAETAVLENEGDIYECGYYDVALIECYSEGVLSDIPEETWYNARYDSNSDYTVTRREKPAHLEGLVYFAMG